MQGDAIVHIVDDDLAVRQSLSFLLASDGFPVRLHESASQFLDNVREAPTGCIITGNRLPYAPESQITTSFGYSHQRGIDAFVENVFVGRQFGDDLNAVDPTPNGQTGAIPSQTYWNATANYKIEKWRSTFFVTAKNIFDRTFIVDRSRGILPSQPRLIHAGVKVNL